MRVKGEASFSKPVALRGLRLKLHEDVAYEVTTAAEIIVIRFERPVNVPVERLTPRARPIKL